MRKILIAILATMSSPALASPDCSSAGAKPSSECAAKMEYCKETSVVLVLAVRGRADGMTEDANLARFSSNREAWFVKHAALVKDIVHQVYSKEPSYRKLRAAVAPSLALALAKLANGCTADPTVTVEP